MGSGGIYGEKDQIKSINHSINQSNFYSTNIPGVARLSGAAPRSVFKYEVVEARSVTSTGSRAYAGVYGGGGRPSQKGMFWDVFWRWQPTWLNGQSSGRLFQREGANDLKALAPVLILILGTDRVIPLFDLSERDGREMAIKERR